MRFLGVEELLRPRRPAWPRPAQALSIEPWAGPAGLCACPSGLCVDEPGAGAPWPASEGQLDRSASVPCCRVGQAGRLGSASSSTPRKRIVASAFSRTTRCSRRVQGRAEHVLRNPARLCTWRPTAMFSRALILETGECAETSAPCPRRQLMRFTRPFLAVEEHCPESGASAPKNQVEQESSYPAPLGPMSALMLPAATVKTDGRPPACKPRSACTDP